MEWNACLRFTDDIQDDMSVTLPFDAILKWSALTDKFRDFKLSVTIIRYVLPDLLL